MTITSAACLTLGLVWFLMRDLRAVSQTSEKQKNNAAKLNWQFFRKGKLFYFMGVACLTGMIRDGLTTWAPVYFSDEFSLNATLSLILSAVLPAAKILALAVHPTVQKKVSKTRTQLIVFYAGCAAAAGIVLLALFKDNLGDVCLHDCIFNIQIPAQFLDFVQIQIFKSQIHGDGMNREVLWIKTAQTVQGIQQCQTVFSARYADSNFVALLDHLIIVHGFADVTQYLL